MLKAYTVLYYSAQIVPHTELVGVSLADSFKEAQADIQRRIIEHNGGMELLGTLEGPGKQLVFMIDSKFANVKGHCIVGDPEQEEFYVVLSDDTVAYAPQ